MMFFKKKTQKEESKKLLPLGEHFRDLIDHPISSKRLHEEYTGEFWLTPQFLSELMYLVHLHRAEIEKLKSEIAEKEEK